MSMRIRSTENSQKIIRTLNPENVYYSLSAHQPDFHASPLSRRGRCSRSSFQSPYRDRVSGLLQIAVSTVLRTNDIPSRQPLPAEHCRYGTTDFSPTELARAAASPPLVTRPQSQPKSKKSAIHSSNQESVSSANTSNFLVIWPMSPSVQPIKHMSGLDNEGD